MPSTIRRATADDFPRIFHLARQAFPIQASERGDLERMFVPERNAVFEEDGRIVARAVGFPGGHWFGGRVVPSIEIAGVTVSPEARGRGHGTRIVRWLLDEAAHEGIPLSALYPATIPIYRTLGYGDAFHRTGFTAQLSSLPRGGGEDVTIREIADEHVPAIRRAYDAIAARGNGLLARDDEWWTMRVLSEQVPFRYVALQDGEVTGWLLHSFQRAKDDWRQDIQARDLFWTTFPAARALLGVAALHRSTCVKLKWAGPLDEPLHLVMHDHAIDLTDHFRGMLRLLDVPAALSARGYPESADVEVAFRVVDPERPANEGPWRLTVRKGEATVEPAATADAVVTVQTLASIYSSLLAPRDAVRTGGLTADDETLDALATAFAGPAPWLADFF